MTASHLIGWHQIFIKWRSFMMGIMERKEREKQQRREDILNAAEKVFFSKGLENATMDEVAEMAELSKGTLYLYFKNKEELYLGITLRALNIMDKMMFQASETEGTGLERVFALGEAYVQFYKSHPNYFNALLYYEAKTIELGNGESMVYECHHVGHDSLDIVVQVLKDGVEDGSIRPDIDPELMARILWGQTTGLIQMLATKGSHFERQHHFNIDDLIEGSFALTMRGLENPKNKK